MDAADGAVWFTDPTYGIDSDYEGAQAESEIGATTSLYATYLNTAGTPCP